MAANKPQLGLVTGCFDLLHPGHIRFLRFAASKVDQLLVGIESDSLVREHKGPTRPIFSAQNRRLILSELKSISRTFLIRPHTDYFKLLRRLHPDCLIISRHDRFLSQKRAICHQLGITLIQYPHLSPYSTTQIIKRIRN